VVDHPSSEGKERAGDGGGERAQDLLCELAGHRGLQGGEALRGDVGQDEGRPSLEAGPRSAMWAQTNAVANTSDTMVITFNRMFMAGPEVSLNGSPTVSPTTAALWGSEPFPP
jgi:hypothetical protein